MDENYIMNGMITFLNMNFPGGFRKFMEDGGCMIPVPGDYGIGSFLYYLPINVPEGFQKAVEDNNRKVDQGFSVRIIKVNDLNDLISHEDLLELAKNIKHEMVFIHQHELVCLGISILSRVDEEGLKAIKEQIKGTFPGIRRGYIHHIGGVYYFSFETAPAQSVERVKGSVVSEDRSVIMPDDITNLKIMLGQCNSIDDLLNNM